MLNDAICFKVVYIVCGYTDLRSGFLLLYKRLEDGSFPWPRTPQEAAELTREQYRMLMMELNPLNPKIKDVNPQKNF